MRKLIPVALLSLLGATHHDAALAAAQRVLVTGTLGTTAEGDPTQLLTNVNPWLGQRFTIDLRIDSSTSTYSHDPVPGIPGAFENSWSGNVIQYSISIASIGTPTAFSGVSTTFNWIASNNDLTIPSGLQSLPPLVQVGHTYDWLNIANSGVGLGCIPGAGHVSCNNSPSDTYEGLTAEISYFWDTAQHDALADDSFPLLNGGPDFSKGNGNVYFSLWHYHPGQSDGSDLASITGNIDSITVTTVPLPQGWALLLPALGMVGMMKRRKA